MLWGMEDMENFKTLDSSIIAIIILIFIYYNARNRLEKVFISNKVFLGLVRANIFLILSDIGAWVFDGLPGIHFLLLNKIFNLLLFVVEPVTGTLWILYVCYQMKQNEKRIERMKYYLAALLLINGVMSVVSLHTGWFFYVNSSNLYSRGSLYLIHILYCYILLIYSMYYVYKNRRRIEKRYYYSMLVFILPITIGATIQIIFYGWALAWTGMMVSLLIIYFNIQDSSLITDYLTGVYNRRQLDKYLVIRVKNSTETKTFSAILIDLDGFKKINDTFGHDIGDEAIKDAAQIIKRSLSREDFVARYGGDEFFAILNTSDKDILEAEVSILRDNVEKFNQESEKGYKLSFAIGYAVYDYKMRMKPDDFFRYIDTLMYSNKG
ncbi:MAG: diguanylate cyclase protein [Herbinix sp.]|jgi:diguanylate cyclase (GGDEF)-like protein|nr:diguanylate cyclase protein [Herbinix sp.]